MTAQAGTGRTNQKQRTRTAIVAAARELIGTGAEVTMPVIAREALAGVWPPPAEALAPVAESVDPVERVRFACEFLLRGILARQGSVRAMIAATITRPETVKTRPGIRFGLIDHALLPLEDTLGTTEPDAFAQLKRDLAVVVSAEAFFTLTDLCGLDPEEAVISAVRTAATLTEAAVRPLA